MHYGGCLVACFLPRAVTAFHVVEYRFIVIFHGGRAFVIGCSICYLSYPLWMDT